MSGRIARRKANTLSEASRSDPQRHFIGIDLGTTGVRALRIDRGGNVIAAKSAAYPLLLPAPGWVEQDPEAWWAATREVLAFVVRADPSPVAAIGLAGQMHGSVFLDDGGRSIRPALLWNDQRTTDAVLEIEACVGRERLREITGNAALTGFQAPKVLWLRTAEPENYRRIAALLLPKDYVRYRLTGVLGTDASDASGTLFLDVRTRDWSEPMLRALNIPRAWLPPVAESPVVTATVSHEGANATGLLRGTPVVAGASDNAAAAIGSGVVRAGSGAISLGTSGVVLAHEDHLRIDPSGALHAFCAAVPGAYHLMGVMLSAGGSLRWLRETIAPGSSYDDLIAEARAVAPCATGLTFLPYLSGERTPLMDPQASGAFVGLRLTHGRAHLTRAVLEGVAYGLASCVALMRGLGVDPHDFVATGNGMSGDLWRSIISATVDRPLRPLEVDEGPAFGAALLAAVGSGEFASVEAAVAAAVRVAPAGDVPPSHLVERYRSGYAVFTRLYPALRSVLEENDPRAH